MGIVKENINFKRGQETKKSLELGKYSPEVMKAERDQFTNKLAEVGISSHWSQLKNNPIWQWVGENKLSDKTDRARLNYEGQIFYTNKAEEYESIRFWFPEGKKPKGPFIFFKHGDYDDPDLADEASTIDEAVKKLLELEYAESFDWNYLNALRKILEILES